MKKFAFIALGVPALLLLASHKDPQTTAGWGIIRPESLYGYCKTLAAKPFAGRFTGHGGYTAAARWAAERFSQWGLKPIDRRHGFLQPYPSPYSIVDQASMTLYLAEAAAENAPGPGSGEPALKPLKLEAGKDFMPLLYSDSGDQEAGLVFAGWGIHAPELNYDDYAGIDARGRFVLCFRGTPDPKDDRFGRHDEHRRRMQTAKEMGAAGLIYIYPEADANPNGDRIPGFLPALITETAADSLFQEKKSTVAELKKALSTYGRPLSFPLRSRLRLQVKSRHFPQATGYNIAGIVAGSDPRLRDEFVVFGAHFDHCGEHLGLLFPGANDNASGSAVVLQLAEAFARLSRPPKRSLLFVLFGGEEMGLQGSHFFAQHLPSVCKKIAAMFNFDMVGEGDKTGCGLSTEPAELKAVLEKADRTVRTLARIFPIRQVGVRSSDFAPFFLQGIPCLSFWSNGPHLHYHQAGDTIYRINPDMLADVARLAYLTAYDWADR